MEKEVWHFYNQEFYNEEDALKAAREMEKQWKYHIEYEADSSGDPFFARS